LLILFLGLLEKLGSIVIAIPFGIFQILTADILSLCGMEKDESRGSYASERNVSSL